MKDPFFLLHDIIFPEVSIKANMGYKPDNATKKTEPIIKIGVQENEKGNLFRVNLFYDLSETQNNDPYEICVVAIGFFEIKDKDSRTIENIADFHLWSGPALVYGALREYIANITSRNFHGSFFISPYIFSEENYITQEDITEFKKEHKKSNKTKIN